MEYLIQGMVIGLGLNVLLGPIFVIITQTSIDKGARAGLSLTGGIWVSDAIMAYLCLMFISKITPYTSDPKFKFYLGLIGGLILIFIGMRLIYVNNQNANKEVAEIKKIKAINYLTYAMQGFLVNTINPFTVFFWIGVFTTFIFGSDATSQQTTFFLIGLFGVIISSDTIKVFLAKKIRKYLNKDRMFKLNKYSGIIFICLGVILMLRSVI